LLKGSGEDIIPGKGQESKRVKKRGKGKGGRGGAPGESRKVNQRKPTTYLKLRKRKKE